MSSLTSDILVTGQDLYSQTSNVSTTVPYYTQTPLLGVRAVTGDGREFRLCQVGATALVVGKLYSTAAQITNHHNLTPTAASIGATSVTVTLGATAATANQYLNGYLLVEADSGGTPGYMYQIGGNPAANSSATLTVQLNDPLQLAITTAAKVTLLPNNYSGVIISAAAATGVPVGAAIYPVTASYYGWVQTVGPAAVLSDGAITVGVNVVKSSSVAGAVAVASSTLASVGFAIETTTDTQYGMFELALS